MRVLALAGLVVLAAAMGCAQIVGADFDGAHAAGETGGTGSLAGAGGIPGFTLGAGGGGGTAAPGGGSNAAPTTCSDAAYEVGCCASDGNVYYCSKGVLGGQTCASGTCGFNAMNGQYECNTNGQPDPSGKHPAACGSDVNNAQQSCVAVQTAGRLGDNGCNACVAQLCAEESKGIDTCAADKTMCESQCAKDVACICTCEVSRPNGCSALYRCIDIECGQPCE